MLKTEEFFMIRELHQKGWSLTAIAKETGFDRKTIRKYINVNANIKVDHLYHVSRIIMFV
ncbi:transposase [Planococcus sp. PAMC 21323]|nr:transposase [Planococcus sp. PAMC 21323]